MTDNNSQNKKIFGAGWIFLTTATVYLILIFASYSKADPGWSHAATVARLHNQGGRTGAYLADLMLFIFGFSAWWCCVMLLGAVWRRLKQRFHSHQGAKPGNYRKKWARRIGFVLLLLSSTGIEYLWLQGLSIQLPRSPGGVLGDLIGGGTQNALGVTGATLILSVLLVQGFSLSFRPLSLLREIYQVVKIVKNNQKTLRERVEEEHRQHEEQRRQESLRQREAERQRQREEQKRREAKREQEEQRQREEQRRQEEKHQQGQQRQRKQEQAAHDIRTDEEILGVVPNCDFEILKKAYREQSQRLHPDKWQSRPAHIRTMVEEEQKLLNAAYARLKTRFE